MSKYGAQRTGGFASKLEAALYDLLLLREKAGEIRDLKTQPNVYLTDARIRMIPDFSYEENGALCFAEAKGVETDVYRIKRKLWKFYGWGKLEVWKGSYKKLYLAETITPR